MVCRDDECRVDMFTIHYAPDADRGEEFICPGCGSQDGLESLDSNI